MGWKFFDIIMNFFAIIVVIHTLILYFCFALIDLINDYKKNHKIVCLYNGLFIQIVSMWWFFVHIVSMWWFFVHVVSFRIIFSMKRGYVNV